jgi:hypothetical protein
VTMATVAGNARVDWALGHAAVNGRLPRPRLHLERAPAGHHPPSHRVPVPDPRHPQLGPDRHDPNRSDWEPGSYRGVGGDRVSAAPALPVEVEQLMRQLKMPYVRALAPELIATAKAQRWDPVEVIKALLREWRPRLTPPPRTRAVRYGGVRPARLRSPTSAQPGGLWSGRCLRRPCG